VAARALAELAVEYAVSGTEGPARQHLAAALEGASETEERYAAEALVRILDGRPDEALTVLDGAARKGTQRADLEYVRAQAHLAQGDVAKARRILAQVAAFSSTSPRIQATYGDVLMDLGEAEAAGRAYAQALAANPAHLRAKLGELTVRLRRAPDKAAEAALASLQTSGELTPALAARAAKAAPSQAIAVDPP
jgi:tetratricopeptide (TPR) repeat protein